MLLFLRPKLIGIEFTQSQAPVDLSPHISFQTLLSWWESDGIKHESRFDVTAAEYCFTRFELRRVQRRCFIPQQTQFFLFTYQSKKNAGIVQGVRQLLWREISSLQFRCIKFSVCVLTAPQVVSIKVITHQLV